MMEGARVISFDKAFAALPLVAILRGIQPDEVAEIGPALVDAGFRIIEVPLNSPEPLRSVEALAGALGDRAVVGAGTVMSEQAVQEVAAAGGRLIVMPHGDPTVIRAAKTADLICMPGVATPTEGFAALAAGADALKLFPAEAMPPKVVKAWSAVFPPETALLPVGGITPETMADYLQAGARGFGLGSALYRPGDSAERVAANAKRFVDAWQAQACPDG